jgi:antitoxin (DNA-binding transcriptional repressor) of toxin-antitoxin stability system
MSKAGAEILVTRRGQPVARIVPVQPSRERQLTPEQEAALERTRRRLEKGWDLGGGKFNRDELYDEILAR